MPQHVDPEDGLLGTRHLALVVNDVCLSGQRRNDLVTLHRAQPAAALP